MPRDITYMWDLKTPLREYRTDCWLVGRMGDAGHRDKLPVMRRITSGDVTHGVATAANTALQLEVAKRVEPNSSRLLNENAVAL